MCLKLAIVLHARFRDVIASSFPLHPIVRLIHCVANLLFRVHPFLAFLFYIIFHFPVRLSISTSIVLSFYLLPLHSYVFLFIHICHFSSVTTHSFTFHVTELGSVTSGRRGLHPALKRSTDSALGTWGWPARRTVAFLGILKFLTLSFFLSFSHPLYSHSSFILHLDNKRVHCSLSPLF